jgi:hypothetical protein
MVLALAYVTAEGVGISCSAELLAMFTGPVELPEAVLVLWQGGVSPQYSILKLLGKVDEPSGLKRGCPCH